MALVRRFGRPLNLVRSRVEENTNWKLRPLCGSLAPTITDAAYRLQMPLYLQPSCTFFSFPSPLGNKPKRKEFSERRLLGYSMEQMYEVVSQVEDYHRFLPWCISSKVLLRRPGHLKANMEIGYPPLIEKYTSSVTLARPHLIKAVCTEGRLFNHLLTIWKFSPGVPHNSKSCILDFSVAFEFRSSLHSHLSQVFFDEIIRQMANAFLKEAEVRFGKQSTILPPLPQCSSS